MHPMKKESESSGADKKSAMGLSIKTAVTGEGRGNSQALPDTDGSQGMASGAVATGYGSKGDDTSGIDGKKTTKRIDRPGKFARGGNVGKKSATTVNVIVAPGGAGGGAPPPPMPMPPPGAPPMGAGAPPMPMPLPGPGAGGPMRKGGRAYKNGGKVDMADLGAGGGLGRLRKIEEYGKKAKA